MKRKVVTHQPETKPQFRASCEATTCSVEKFYDRCINGAGSAPIKVARPRHSWNNWIGFCSCESRPSTIGGTRPFSTHATRLFRARYHGSLGFTIFSSKDATFSHREYPTWSHSIVCFIFCSTIFWFSIIFILNFAIIKNFWNRIEKTVRILD